MSNDTKDVAVLMAGQKTIIQDIRDLKALLAPLPVDIERLKSENKLLRIGVALALFGSLGSGAGILTKLLSP